MFRGNHPAKVDEKGRLKIPSAFKQLVDASNVTQFYITSVTGTARRSGHFRSGEAGSAVGRVQHFGRRGAEVPELDQLLRPAGGDGFAGPVAAAADFAGTAQLNEEVTVFGKMTYLEVHNRKVFESKLEENR